MIISSHNKSLRGSVNVIVSKSQVHRLLICAALSGSPTVIEQVQLSKDIQATIDCINGVLADVLFEKDVLSVKPYILPKNDCLLDCNESGSTFRMLLPVFAALGNGCEFTGRPGLEKRPISPLYELLSSNGCTLSQKGKFPLSLGGKLMPSGFEIDGNISSQFISGLLFAAPLLQGDSSIAVTKGIQSYPYIQMTLDALQRFKIDVEVIDKLHYKIKGGQKFISPGRVVAEGDWSNAAFWMVAAAIGRDCDVTVRNINPQSIQGDKKIAEILKLLGAHIEYRHNDVRVRSGRLTAVRIDASDIPDLVPVLAVAAAAAIGKTEIVNAQRLRYKESDRLETVYRMLLNLGADIKATDSALIINGTGRLTGGVVDSYNDHRIAMAAAVASLICEHPVEIKNSQAVEKSYPLFFEEFNRLTI
ncbi:MAG: 3-phosphoshikimate 1-carboxyvinyltransferase [bacterium]|nr:3-phosphoshikimate 1-carboxyvinyltransferase [bacterium]